MVRAKSRLLQDWLGATAGSSSQTLNAIRAPQRQ